MERPAAVITFNVLFTPSTPARLLPFAFSLLQGTGVCVRVVANGCTPADVDLLRAAAQVDDRISLHVLAGSRAVEHGLALNQVFDAFHEPYFAIADSDVIASADFMTGLWPLAPGQAAVFAASPVWATDEETVVPPRCTYLGGRLRVLRDGTPVGNTYLAIYERAAVEPLWRAAPRGFAVHERDMLPRSVQVSLSARGWRYRWFDTCRLLNLQLALEGHTLENRVVPALHHFGRISRVGIATPGEGLGAMFRTGLEILRSSEGRRLQRIVDGTAHRLYLSRRSGDLRYRRMEARRRVVSLHLSAVLDAILTDEPVPPSPPTGSAEVDRRLAALVVALETHYRPGVSLLQAATRSGALLKQ